jgi:methyl-accepting chemotaxis protein
MFSNLKLSTKLIAGFIIVAVITLVVGCIGWYGVTQLSGHLDEIGVVRLPSIESLLIISEAQTAVDSAENALLEQELSAAKRQEQYDRVDEALHRAEEAWAIYAPLPQTKEEEILWNRFVPAWEKWKKDHSDYMSLSRQYDTNKTDEIHTEMVKQALEVNGISFAASEDLLNQIVQINDETAEEAVEAAASETTVITAITIIGMIIGTVLALFLGIFLSNSITKPLVSISGSLTEGSQQVASASEQLSSSSQQLAEGGAEQASSIEETSSTIEEASSMIKQNTDNTKQAATLSKQAKDAADKGNREMKEMMSSMNELKKSSDDISKIIKVIDEIAFQTNILALNAAVEAARAGEAGMGFAVVAEEVRNLAQRCAQAAKDTAAMIEGNIELSEKGVGVSNRVNESLSEINTQAQKVNELLDEISAASQEQTQGMMQINKAISQMEQVVQENASSAEETASSAEELSAQSENIKDIVNQLMGLINGKNANGKQGINYSYSGKDNKKPDRAASGSNGYNKLAVKNSTDKNVNFKKTKVVNPEEVIPLSEDNADF